MNLQCERSTCLGDKGTRRRVWQTALPLAFLWAHATYAEEEPAKKELAPVIVTAGRGTNVEDMDVSTTVMTKEDVQKAPQASVDQILNRIPGIFIPHQPSAQLHPTGGTFGIRGFGTSTNVNTLVLVDGIVANDAYFRTVDWTKIPKDSIERIEVIRGGGATSLWGNLAMGGIVNVVTREPKPGEKRVNASYSSFDTVSGGAALTAYSNEYVRFAAAYDGMQSDGYNKTPEQFRNPNMTKTSGELKNVLLSALVTPSADAKYFVKVLTHGIEEQGLVWQNTKNEWTSDMISAGGVTKFSNGGSINAGGWYDYGTMATQNVSLKNGTSAYTFNIYNPMVGVPYVSQTEKAQYHSGGLSIYYGQTFGVIKDFKIGFDARDIKADDPLNIFAVSGAQTQATIAHGEHRIGGVFTQGTWRPESIPLDVTLGLRQDFWRPMNGSIEGTTAGVPSKTILDDRAYQHFDPRLGAKYYFESGFNLRAAVYGNFSAPGMNQLYRSFVSGSSYTATNPDLKPQTNFGREAGADYKGSWGEVNFTVFSNQMKGYIDFVALCTTAADCSQYIKQTGLATGTVSRVNQYVNAGDATLTGAEFIGSWKTPVKALMIHGGLTGVKAYLTSTNYRAADPTGIQLGQVPKWTGNLGLAWKMTDHWEFVVQVKSFPSYWNNTAHTQKNGAATLTDVSLSYKPSTGVTVYGTVENIGHVEYFDQGYGYTTANGSWISTTTNAGVSTVVINPNTVNTSTIPSRGQPLVARIGVKGEF